MVVVKRFVHVLSTICYIMLSLFLIICLPILAGYKPLVVLTGSMEPTYMTGSVVYYKSASIDEINPGDAITFISGSNTIVTHRVYMMVSDGVYETKGDANESIDPNCVSYDNILGKTANISIPYVGFCISFVHEHMYLILVIALILVLEFLLSNMEIFNINKKGNRGLGYEENSINC